MSYKKSIEEIIAANNKRKHRKPREQEHRIQCACVQWFRYKYPTMKKLLFAVPNGGRRDKTTGAKLKAEGVVPGVSDLILLAPNRTFHGLCIEMKKKGGRQSEEQRNWQTIVQDEGYQYVVCHSFDEFKNQVEDYLSNY